MKHDEDLATKGDIAHLDKKFDAYKDEILRHFDLMVETIRHDLLGANRDQIELLKDKSRDFERRISRLEQSTGMIAA